MDKSININLKESVKSLPALPGVYLFRDTNNRVIYVGKAKNIKKRAGSYFSKKTFENNKIKILVKLVRRIDHIVVDTESDALLLENNLIKEYKPRYNVLLKDDKSFPYLCIRNEPFSRVFSTRNPVRDGSAYYGPYTSVYMVRMLLELIRQLFPLRNCNYYLSEENIKTNKFKVCLEYHIGNCKGPCEGLQTSSEYSDNIKQIKDILKGNISSVKNFLEQKMKLESREFAYEKAQETKEKLELLEKYQSKSTIVNPSLKSLDVYSIVENQKLTVANFIKVVDGAVIQSRTLEMKKVLNEKIEDLLSLVITEIRSNDISRSSEIVVPFLPEMNLPGVKITIPARGDKKRLLDLSTRNAKYYLKEKEKSAIIAKSNISRERILEKAMDDLRLTSRPDHIECFDNSNMQGANPVSACVVFRNAEPSKKEYRHFNVNAVKGPNDFETMKEVIFRRYNRMILEGIPLPQLIVVDGGKAQLSAAIYSLEKLALAEQVKVIAIAKRLEEIYFPGDPVPIYLDKKSETLKLIQHLRNEAHRFSLRFHRTKRSNHFTKSELESVTGLGIKTVEKLYSNFGDLENVRNSSLEQLTVVIGKAKAKILLEYLKGEKR